MISVKEAKHIIESQTEKITSTESTPLQNALNRRLSEDIYASMDLPPFNQSNVDGYAVCGIDCKEWKVIEEVKAGDHTTTILKNGEAVRIFTGAMVPDGADCIIMQERVLKNDTTISCDGKPVKNEHIRAKGSQIKTNEIALKKGTLLQPSALGFIAMLGINEVMVHKQPIVSLIITGNELQTIGAKPLPGKVFESNSFSLSAALQSLHLTFNEVTFVKDDKKSLSETVNKLIGKCDLLLVSGGISVGDYDFVNEVLKENETQTLFYKISQKPGKPLFFGKNEHTHIFGLPGNPASALTCFYEYVYPCLQKMMGSNADGLRKLMLPSETPIKKKAGLAHFLKAKVHSKTVLCLEGQESYKIRSFAEANAFIYLPLEKENVEAGELVEVHLYP